MKSKNLKQQIFKIEKYYTISLLNKERIFKID